MRADTSYRGISAKLGTVAAKIPAAAAAEESAPAWVQLMPLGEVRTRPHDGRPSWHVTDTNAVVAATRAVGLPLAVDYEHQTELARANGQPAPAAGWITDIEARPDGIYGQVAWTAKASAMIRAGEYKFLSPVFRFDPKTREVRRIVMAGLTNDRALADLKAVAKRENVMDELVQKLSALLGLGDEADETAIVEAVAALVEAANPDASDATAAAKADRAALGRVAGALGLEAQAKSEAIEQAAVGAAAAAVELGELKAEMENLKTRHAEEQAIAAVDAAVAGGKLPPYQRQWALDYARRDLKGFAAFAKAQLVLVKPSATPRTPPAGGGGALTAEEKAVCTALGLTEEKFLAGRRAFAAEELAEETARR